jgi:uncharacterized protein
MKAAAENINWDLIGSLGLAKSPAGSLHYVLQDDQVFYSNPWMDGIELLPLEFALQKYNWVQEKFLYKTVSSNGENRPENLHGYFLHVHKNQKISFLCQAALILFASENNQCPHNIIVLDEGAELTFFTGCTSAYHTRKSGHYSTSELFIGKNATLIHNLIHKWSDQIDSTSQSGAVVEEGGKYICNDLILRPAHKMVSNPVTWLIGKNATVKYNTIIFSDGSTEAELGGEIYLNATNTSAELIHRAVCVGGKVTQKGLLIGNAKCRAHVDCAGMVLNSNIASIIESVPGLKALHPEAEMSHEASIGKISPQQVEYLRCRGISEMDATSLIIRGFIDPGIQNIGPEIDSFIKDIVSLAGHGEKKK